MNAAVEKALMSAVRQIVDIAMNVARAEVQGEVLAKLGGVNGAKKNPASRRKGPIQLCPAPSCKEKAAPVFGMLCAKHKDTPKPQVAKWREARRAKAKK